MINLNEMKRDYIGREPRDYIVESVTVPKGLEEKVLAAMTQKRKEIEEIQKEKQEKKAAHKSVALRAAVIAAVITLMILIIPSSRQVVVSAAESAWNAFHSWWSQTMNLNLEKKSANCTIEILDATLGNDFVYFTIEEDFTDALNNLNSNEKVTFVPYYYGYVYDNEGNSAKFVSGNNAFKNGLTFSCDPSFDCQYTIDNPWNYPDDSDRYNYFLSDINIDSFSQSRKCFYAFYSPNLNKIFNSYNKKYYCKLYFKLFSLTSEMTYWGVNENGYATTVLVNDNDQISNAETIANLSFEFDITKFDYMMDLNYEEHEINYDIQLDNMNFNFKNFFSLPSFSDNILVEVTPDNKQNIDNYLYYFKISLNCKTENDNYFYKYHVTNCYYIDSKYYILLSTYRVNNHDINEHCFFDIKSIKYMMLVDNHIQLHTNYFSEDEFNCVRDFIEIENPTLKLTSNNEFNHSIELLDYTLYFNKINHSNQNAIEMKLLPKNKTYDSDLSDIFNPISPDWDTLDEFDFVNIRDIKIAAKKDGKTVSNFIIKHFSICNSYWFDESTNSYCFDINKIGIIEFDNSADYYKNIKNWTSTPDSQFTPELYDELEVISFIFSTKESEYVYYNNNFFDMSQNTIFKDGLIINIQ